MLQLLAAGRSNQAIAEELVVAVGTVKRYVSNIMGVAPGYGQFQDIQFRMVLYGSSTR